MGTTSPKPPPPPPAIPPPPPPTIPPPPPTRPPPPPTRPPTTTSRPPTTTARPPTTTARTTMAITTDIGVTTIEHATTSSGSGTTILKQSVEWRSADNSSSKGISTFFSSTTNRIVVVAGGATVGIIVLLILGFLITRYCKRNKPTKRSQSTRQMMSAVSGAHGEGDQMGSENPYYMDPKQINARTSPVSGARDEWVSAAQSQMGVPNNGDAENTRGKMYVDFDTDVPNIGDAVYVDFDDTDKVTTKDVVCENDAYDSVRYQAKDPAAPGDQTGSENLYLVPKEILDRMPTASNEHCENEVYANI